MNKLIFIFLLIFITSATITIQAQYKLRNAFPNLPPFAYPVELANAKDGSNRLFLVEQHGLVYTFQNNPNVSTRKVFLDLNTRVHNTPVSGLFGLAFHPDYANNRYLYVHYVFDSTGFADGLWWIKISRFETSASNPDTVLRETEVNLLTIPMPGYFHNGGKVAFGPDGYLYVSTGDGSNNGDSSQNRKSLLGKVIRINVDSAAEGKNYSIPDTNPFYSDTLGYAKEIYAYGLRNPWKFSFDFPTNRLYLGDVGQTRYEEIDIVESGKNYGWNKMEGFHCFPYPPAPCDTAGRGFTRPILEYSQYPLGEAVTGGYVYRGSLLPDLYGKYIYGDYINAKFWALTYDGSVTTSNTLLFDTSFFLVSFGVDESNELYVCSYSETSPDGYIHKFYDPNIITLDLKVIIEGLYNVTEDILSMRDTVSVYLCNLSNPHTISDSSKTVIDSLTFRGLCFFKNAPSGNYYIVVKYKNGLETWSKFNGLNLTRGLVTKYDFTNEITNSFGNNLKLKGTRYCIYSGDCNSDGIINAFDRAIIIGKLGFTGSLPADLDGNQVVNAIDRSIVISNLGKSRIIP